MRHRLANKRLQFPSKTDEMGAQEALVRLHRVYNLSTEDLADGRIQDFSGSPMSDDSLYRLARRARLLAELSIAEDCLKIILKRNNSDADRNVKLKEIASELASIYVQVGKTSRLKFYTRVIVISSFLVMMH